MTFRHDPPCTHNVNSSGSGVACPFNLGNSGQIVGVQVRYWRPFIIPWIGGCLSGGGCWAGARAAPRPNPRTVMQTSVVVFQYQEPASDMETVCGIRIFPPSRSRE